MKQINTKKMFLIFSHQLTDLQKQDACLNLNISEFIYLPDNLQRKWLDISPYEETLSLFLQDLLDWLKINAKKDDYVLVQGDFGAVFLVVDFCFKNELVPVYSTTKRQIVNEETEGENVNISRVFSHVRFRKYERWV
ncbi:MAG: CRISPR-associated protein Csx20 [Thermoanaerobacteraceae bacterium]|nr:CRISPR-associated protein Csx20 [Thermoanaerobacteraceae bacterium]